jgi:Co/Zn/Cd efflux system component
VLDSVGDCISTALVAVAFALEDVTEIPFDAIAGIIASLVVIFGGIKLIFGTINKLMGGGADEETEKLVFETVTAHKEVLGVHDLRVHDYGAGRRVASVDAEFDEHRSFSEVHSVVDEIEREVKDKLGIELVVHPDPVSSTDEDYLAIRHLIIETVTRYGNDASFHELTVSSLEKKVSLHLRLSKELMKYKESITAEIIENVTSSYQGFMVVVEYDFM